MDISNVIEHMNSEEIKEFVNRGSSTETTETTATTATTETTNASALTTEITENNTSTDADDITDADADDITDSNADDNVDVDDNDNAEEEYNDEEDDDIQDDDIQDGTNKEKVSLYYDEYYELQDEEIMESYHKEKNFGNWHYAKRIISHSNDDKQATEFFSDYLERQLRENNDNFNNIKKVYYKNDLDVGIIFEFEEYVAKYLVDNLKIQEYKPKGYIFSGDENQNKWAFKIIVITSKGIYSANRYITDSIIGCY